MILQTILEGLGLGILLVLVCAVGIRKGAVGMVHLYSPAVQQRCVKLGLTTHEKIKRNSLPVSYTHLSAMRFWTLTISSLVSGQLRMAIKVMTQPMIGKIGRASCRERV